jgi:hypothetical protein
MASFNPGSLIGSIFGKSRLYDEIEAFDDLNRPRTSRNSDIRLSHGRPFRRNVEISSGRTLSSDGEESDSDRDSSNAVAANQREFQWAQPTPYQEEEEQEIPQSLLMEPRKSTNAGGRSNDRTLKGRRKMGASSATHARSDRGPILPLHHTDVIPEEDENVGRGRLQRAPLAMLDARERALWKWANVDNSDLFLQEVRCDTCILLSDAR